jgi:hypothetical protein
MRQQIADTCEVTCIDNGRKMTADILDFRQGEICQVSINKAIKLTLHYDEWSTEYIGRNAGLEFKTPGPKIINSIQGR